MLLHCIPNDAVIGIVRDSEILKNFELDKAIQIETPRLLRAHDSRQKFDVPLHIYISDDFLHGLVPF